MHDAALFENNPKFRELLVKHARELVEGMDMTYEEWVEALKDNVEYATGVDIETKLLMIKT